MAVERAKVPTLNSTPAFCLDAKPVNNIISFAQSHQSFEIGYTHIQ